MRIAVVYSSKHKAQEVRASRRSASDTVEENDEPPDLLAEYDSDETVSAVLSALSLRHKVIAIEGDENAYENLKKERPDLAFNISEGLPGPNRESQIPILCEMLDLPYTGSDGLTLGICLDKARTKEILSYHNVPNARFVVVSSEGDEVEALNEFPLPAIVKPLREGSSIGIACDSVVHSRAQLLEKVKAIQKLYRQETLVEQFLPGREFTMGVLGNEPELEFLPLVEIDHSVLPEGATPVYGYEAKWLWDDPADPLPILICPARIDSELEAEMRGLVRRALNILRVRDWCRIDLRLDSTRRPMILELNPLPGILPDPKENSALPAAARAAGYSYEGLLLRVAEVAARRYGIDL
jgi:D-alanine-D-alanine ligase